MSTRTKYVIAGVVAIVALLFLPGWLKLLAIAAVIGVPVAGYLMLDPSQRRRLKRISRKQLDR